MSTSKFKRSGYFTFKNFLNQSEKKKIVKVISQVYSKYFFLDKKRFSIESQDFHNKLLKLRAKNPNIFGEIYDQFKLNAQLRSIFYNNKFLRIFSKILNTKVEKIYLNGFMLRLDAPNDKKNILDWHQDTPHYLMTNPKMNSGVCWVSITKNSRKNGTLVYIPGSHREFIQKFYKTKKNKNSSESLKITLSKKELVKAKNLNQSFGDVSFLHLNLKHQ